MDYLLRWLPVFAGAGAITAYALFLDRQIAKGERELESQKHIEPEQPAQAQLPFGEPTTSWRRSA